MKKKVPAVIRQVTNHGVYLFSYCSLPSGERKRVYFGKEDDPESQTKILAFRRQFLAGRFERVVEKREPAEISIAYLATRYLDGSTARMQMNKPGFLLIVGVI